MVKPGKPFFFRKKILKKSWNQPSPLGFTGTNVRDT